MFNRNVNIISNQSSQASLDDKTNMATVHHVVLDIDDTILDILEVPKDLKPLFIGSVQFRRNGNNNKSDEDLPLAIPYNRVYTSLPTKNEVVRIIYTESGGYYYERIIKTQTPNVSSTDNVISEFTKRDKPTGSNSKQYSNVQTTGISRSSTDTSTNDNGYGNYFELNPNIHYLKLYEGDTLIESRFGQSLRFSAYNNSNNEFSPTIILRNGESLETISAGAGISTEEDVNNDGNIIFLGSGQRLLDYTLPVDNSYQSFFNYPSELTGNQILLNSDRIILSAKNAEMIFASKKDTGFITDGQFSIDATGGINVTTDSSIFVDTKDRDFNIDIGDGTIFLGTDGELEAAPKGETLVELLGELIDLIAQQIYLTPSGPTKAGPTNVAEFSALKSKLNSILSNNVQLK
jgi:hypothetical protein